MKTKLTKIKEGQFIIRSTGESSHFSSIAPCDGITIESALGKQFVAWDALDRFRESDGSEMIVDMWETDGKA